MNSTDHNPLLTDDALPCFDAIAAADVAPAINQLIVRCEQALAQATQADGRFLGTDTVMDCS